MLTLRRIGMERLAWSCFGVDVWFHRSVLITCPIPMHIMATGAHFHRSTTCNTWFPVSTTVSVWNILCQHSTSLFHLLTFAIWICTWTIFSVSFGHMFAGLSNLVFAPIRNHCPWKKPSDSWLRPKPLVCWSRQPQLLSQVAHRSLEVWEDLMDWADHDANQCNFDRALLCWLVKYQAHSLWSQKASD